MDKKLVLIALTGGLGSLARYGLAGLVQRWAGSGFAWGTPVVNLLGCFLFGVIWSLAEERILISGETRAILLVGFLGAFTTFSTYVFETGELLRDAQWRWAAGNVCLQTFGGLAAFFAGLAGGRIL
ncbi:MAG: CrcB family protein [bacterium]